MSLEIKIEKLTEVVIALTVALTSGHPAVEQIAPQPEAKPEKTPKAKPAPIPASEITAEELQGMCMTLVRAKPENKLVIKKLLNNKLLKDVPVSEYQHIKDCLVDLQAELAMEAS